MSLFILLVFRFEIPSLRDQQSGCRLQRRLEGQRHQLPIGRLVEVIGQPDERFGRDIPRAGDHLAQYGLQQLRVRRA